MNIDISIAKSYKTEENLDRALVKLGLDSVVGGKGVPLRFIKCRNLEGRFTAVFLVSDYFRSNKEGGYMGFVAQHGFMSI